MMLGLDLGSESKGTTQAALLDGKRLVILQDTGFAIRDLERDVARIMEEFRPGVAAIDAPLSIPPDLMRTLQGEAPEGAVLFNREVDARLKKDTGTAMPWTMLATISFKGIYVRNLVEKRYPGTEIIEAYPGTFARDFPGGKTADEKGYCRFVTERVISLGFSIEGDIATHDMADAAIAALIGGEYHKGGAHLRISEGGGEKAYWWGHLR